MGAVRERLAGLGGSAATCCCPRWAATRGRRHHPPELIPAVLAQGMGSGPAVHDVCALALVAEPGLFGCQPARVEVETAGRWTAGMTVTEFGAPAGEHNALVVTSIEVPGFWDAVIAAWARVPPHGWIMAVPLAG